MKKALVLGAFAVVIGAVLLLNSRRYTFAVEISPVGTGSVFVVSSDGVEVARSQGADSLEVVVPGGRGLFLNEGVLPELSLERLHSCGWEEVPLGPAYAEPAEVKKALEEDRPVPVRRPTDFQRLSDEDRIATVYVDNRDRPATVIRVGQLELPVEANGFRKWEVPVRTSCPEGRAISIDATIVATFPSDLMTEPERNARRSRDDEQRDQRRREDAEKFARLPQRADVALVERITQETIETPWPAEPPSSHFLIDPTGKQCYDLWFALFGPAGSHQAGHFGNPSRERLAATFLHRIPGPITRPHEEMPFLVDWPFPVGSGGSFQPIPERGFVRCAAAPERL